jgi:hypothetical protein
MLRWKLVRWACGLFVILVAYVCLWPDRRGHLSRENFNRTRNVTTYQQVVGILSPPAAEGWVVSPTTGARILISTWDTDTASAYVNTTESGEVKLRHYEERPLRDTLRRWWMRAFGGQAPF